MDLIAEVNVAPGAKMVLVSLFVLVDGGCTPQEQQQQQQQQQEQQQQQQQFVRPFSTLASFM